MSVVDISSEINRMAKAAKERKLVVDELKGSTFSVSSLGAIGGKFFTPIINPPEVAILGISKTYSKVIMRDKNIKEIPILPISLSLCLSFITSNSSLYIPSYIPAYSPSYSPPKSPSKSPPKIPAKKSTK